MQIEVESSDMSNYVSEPQGRGPMDFGHSLRDFICNKETRCHCQSSSHRISQKYNDALYGPCERWFIHLVRPDRGLPVQMCKYEVFGDNLTYTLLSYTGDGCCVSKRRKLVTKVGNHVPKLLGHKKRCHCITRLSFLPHCLVFERSPCQISWCLSWQSEA
jgi:hypothetical protein